jgi:hypothetical protein
MNITGGTLMALDVKCRDYFSGILQYLWEAIICMRVPGNRLRDTVYCIWLPRSSAGFIKHRRGKRVPSFIKQKKELRWNLLPPFLSNEPGTGFKYFISYTIYRTFRDHTVIISKNIKKKLNDRLLTDSYTIYKRKNTHNQQFTTYCSLV